MFGPCPMIPQKRAAYHRDSLSTNFISQFFDLSDEKRQAHSKPSALYSNGLRFDIEKTELGKSCFRELKMVLFIKIVSL